MTMMRSIMALASLTGTAWAEPLAVAMPSGLVVEYLDEIVEEQLNGETWLTLRYVAPLIGMEEGKMGYDQVSGDIDHLCESEGLSAAARAGGVDQVVIALLDRVVERGTYDPEATMFVGAYLPSEGGCIWQ